MTDDETIEELRERKKSELIEREQGTDTPPEPVHVDGQADFDGAVAEYNVVLADFYADWCGPCKMLEPTVESLAAETEAAVLKVDVDANQALAQQFGVQGVPTLVVFADGEQVEEIVGVQGEDELAATIAQYT
jgi:thioredoxin 1